MAWVSELGQALEYAWNTHALCICIHRPPLLLSRRWHMSGKSDKIQYTCHLSKLSILFLCVSLCVLVTPCFTFPPKTYLYKRRHWSCRIPHFAWLTRWESLLRWAPLLTTVFHSPFKGRLSWAYKALLHLVGLPKCAPRAEYASCFMQMWPLEKANCMRVAVERIIIII